MRGSQNSSVALSQVMNNEFWNTTPRQNAKVGSGTLQNPPVSRKRKMSKSKIKSVLICFFTVWGSSTRNLCHQDKLSIQLFIGKSLKDSGKWWHVCDQALHALGCCTTITPPVTRQSLPMNFWQKKAFLSFLSLPYSPDLSPCEFFLFPGSKTT